MVKFFTDFFLDLRAAWEGPPLPTVQRMREIERGTRELYRLHRRGL